MQYRYSWLKNGQVLDVDAEAGISQRPGKGTITIEIDEVQSHHDGEYQCIASNQFGTAVSVKAMLRRASKCPYLQFIFLIVSRHHHHHHHRRLLHHHAALCVCTRQRVCEQ